MTQPLDLPTLPLLHGGDGYVVELTSNGAGTVRLSAIWRYPNNESVEPHLVPFFHLDEATRATVLKNVRRRHPDKSIQVT